VNSKRFGRWAWRLALLFTAGGILAVIPPLAIGPINTPPIG
jgi:hypothetical protein